MKFSIITPSYNQGRFIRDCLESVRAQAGVECEHLVIDAGSSDETLSVLRDFPQVNWSSEPDKGMSDGINKGFLKATGDWVMWLNTDDYLLPGALAKVAACAGHHPETDVIYGDCLFVNQDKRTLRYKREHRFDFGVLLFVGCYIQSTATFLKRNIVTAGHLLDINYKVCMDFEYYVRLASLGYRFRHYPEALASFRWHATNTSTVLAQRRREERVQVQQNYLQRSGRNWLGREWMLSLMYRLYLTKRLGLRLTTRRPG